MTNYTHPKFCTNCGLPKMEEVEAIGSYDEKTGEKYYAVRIRCPKAKFWNLCDDDYVQNHGIYAEQTGARQFTKKELEERGLQINE